MKVEELMRAIGMIEDGLVMEAQHPSRLKIARRRRRAALAACCAAAAMLPLLPRLYGSLSAQSGAGAQNTVQDTAEKGQESAAQALEPFTLGFSMGDFGFEGILAYDEQELERGCPWQEGDGVPKTLAVYRSRNEVIAGGAARFGLDGGQMEQRLRELAQALGYKADAVEVFPSDEEIENYRRSLEEQGRDPDTDPNYEINTRACSARAEASGAAFRVDTTGQFTMKLKEPLLLPREYQIGPQSTIEDAERTALWLAGRYAKALGVENAQPQVSLEYTSTGERQLKLSVRSGGSLEHQLLEFGLGGLEFYLDDTGTGCTGLRLWGTQAAGELLGEYPVIPQQEAQSLLAEGKCFTSVTEEFPGMEYLAKTELVYREGTDAVAPYYRFMAELPTQRRENGLRTFGAYYVPAVEPEYLTDPPVSQWEMEK